MDDALGHFADPGPGGAPLNSINPGRVYGGPDPLSQRIVSPT
jgi:hypothetical protein